MDDRPPARPPARVLAAFGLHPGSPVEFLSDGWCNRSWRVHHPAGDAVVRQTQDVDADQIRFRQKAVDILAARGLPVPRAVPTTQGTCLLDDPAGLFEATRWIDGEHRAGHTLSRHECTSLGVLLAQIHAAMAEGLPADCGAGEHSGGFVDDAAPVPSRIASDIADIEALHREMGVDGGVVERLRHWYTRLGECAPLEDPGRSARPTSWTHGDFQPLNLLWSTDRVVAVLDWDRLGLRAPADEVARSALVLFGPDLHRTAAFAAGYRSTHPLDDEDLALAIHLSWWRRLDDLCRRIGDVGAGGRVPADDFTAALGGMLTWWCTWHDTIMRLAWGVGPAIHDQQWPRPPTHDPQRSPELHGTGQRRSSERKRAGHMHEASLATSVLAVLRDMPGPHHHVRVHVADISTAPSQLADQVKAYLAAADPPLAVATVEVVLRASQRMCVGCAAMWVTAEPDPACPSCGGVPLPIAHDHRVEVESIASPDEERQACV